MLHKIQLFVGAQSVTAAGFALFLRYLTKTETLPLARDFAPDLSEGKRLTYAFRCLLYSVIPLFLAIVRVALVRLANPTTLGTHPTAPVLPSMESFKIKERILQNTLEQTILHMVAVLALVSVLEPDQLWNIPLLVLLFLIGRAAFFIGYTSSPVNRVFGFVVTVLPTTCALAYSLAVVTLRALS